MPHDPIGSSSLLSSLNGGAGVDLAVGIKTNGANPTNGRPTQDTTFTLRFSRDDGETTEVLTLPFAAAVRPLTSDNATLDDLAGDLNKVFSDRSDELGAYSAIYKEDLQGVVVDERLVLTVLDASVRSLQIDGGASLGFSNGQRSNFADLVIRVSGPSGPQEYVIDLDRNLNGTPVKTVGDVIAVIQTATNDRVHVVPSDDMSLLIVFAWNNGLQIADTDAVVSVMPASTVLDEMANMNGGFTIGNSVKSSAGDSLGILGERHGTFAIFDPVSQLSTGDIPVTANGIEVANALNSILGPGVSVVETTMGEFEIAFPTNAGDVQQLTLISGTSGIDAFVQTLTEGDVGAGTSELQQLTLIGLDRVDGTPLHRGNHRRPCVRSGT